MPDTSRAPRRGGVLRQSNALFHGNAGARPMHASFVAVTRASCRYVPTADSDPHIIITGDVFPLFPLLLPLRSRYLDHIHPIIFLYNHFPEEEWKHINLFPKVPAPFLRVEIWMILREHHCRTSSATHSLTSILWGPCSGTHPLAHILWHTSCIILRAPTHPRLLIP